MLGPTVLDGSWVRLSGDFASHVQCLDWLAFLGNNIVTNKRQESHYDGKMRYEPYKVGDLV